MSDVILAGLAVVVFAAFIFAVLSAVRLNEQTFVLQAATARLNKQTALMNETQRRLTAATAKYDTMEPVEQGEKR